MAIGRTFTESIQKACRSLETGRLGSTPIRPSRRTRSWTLDELVRHAATATPERLFHVEAALRHGASVERLHDATGIDPWFLDQISQLVEARAELAADRGHRRDDPPRLAVGEAARLRRRPARVPVGHHRRRACATPASPPVSRSPTRPSTPVPAEFAAEHAVPLRHLRRRRRGRAADSARSRDPRQRAQPHRPGRGVRLLLRARCVRALGRRVRDGDGQLQPRDGLHRLRHQRPPVLRAARRSKASATCATRLARDGQTLGGRGGV